MTSMDGGHRPPAFMVAAMNIGHEYTICEDDLGEIDRGYSVGNGWLSQDLFAFGRLRFIGA